MKTFLLSLLTALFLTGCGVGHQMTLSTDGEYLHGSYGWMIYDYKTPYDYYYHQSETLYFETPYLQRGCEVYIDIINDYDYAYVDSDAWSMSLYDEWFIGADEAHYSYIVNRSGVQQFWIDDLHHNAIVDVHYACY